MYITQALIVLGTAVFLFFSKEFSEIFKKIASIPGVKLFVPLILASMLIETYEPFFLWLLLQFKKGLHTLFQMVNQLVPIHSTGLTIILLVSCGIAPFLVLRVWEKINKITFIRSATYNTATLIWISAAVLLTIYRP